MKRGNGRKLTYSYAWTFIKYLASNIYISWTSAIHVDKHTIHSVHSGHMFAQLILGKLQRERTIPVWRVSTHTFYCLCRLYGGEGLHPWKESSFICMCSNDHCDFAPFEEFGTQEEVQPFRIAACVKVPKPPGQFCGQKWQEILKS